VSRAQSLGSGLIGRARNNFAYLAAFCMDLSLGAGLVAFSYIAKKTYGATPGQLGLIALISAGVYFGASLVLGRLSDRFGRKPSVIAGSLLGAATFACGAFVSELSHLYILMGIFSAAMASFWPALEADISDNSTAEQLPRRVGRFNVAWCSGFAATGLFAGFLCAHPSIGHRNVLLMAAGIALLVIPIFLLRTYDHDTQPPEEPVKCLKRASEGRVAAFWKMALILNFAAMGTNAVLRYHVPTVTGGERCALGGAYLTILFTAETLTFLLLGRWHAWHHRGWPLAAACLLVVIGGTLCGLAPSSIPLFAGGCALTGIGCGLIYNSSIYYSVATESGKGHRGGIHESALGLGAAVVPYAGGLMAMLSVLASHEDWRKGMPFLVGVGFMLLASLAAALIYPRGTRKTA
jgi:MFS family permease